MTTRIALEGMTFHAFHGVYSHEREKGNTFDVSIEVEADVEKAMHTDALADTVDYEVLYSIVKEKMEQPARLLESVAEHIIEGVLDRLPGVRSVHLKISKLNPPMSDGSCARATLSVSRRRE